MTPITTTADLAAFCDRLRSQPFVAVDTEFMRETTYWPKLCLIQAASSVANSALFHGAEPFRLPAFYTYLKLGFEPWLYDWRTAERWEGILGRLGWRT